MVNISLLYSQSFQNKGRSTDIVRQRCPFVRTNFRFTGHFDRTRKKATRKKNALSHYYVSRGQSSFFILYFLVVTRLVSSRYYRAIFNILTSQKRDEFELRFVWSVNRSPVNTTGNGPKFIFCLVQWNPDFSKHPANWLESIGRFEKSGVKLQCLTGKEEMGLVRIGKLHDDELLLQLPESFRLCFLVQIRPFVFRARAGLTNLNKKAKRNEFW